MKKPLNDIPTEVVNLISVISGVVTIISPIVSIIITIKTDVKPNVFWVISTASLILFCIILFFRMKKYRTLSKERLEVVSENIHKSMHNSRDIFFDIMHSHKLKHLNEEMLNYTYKTKLSTILDHLCNILASYTKRKVCACIKIVYCKNTEDEKKITDDAVELVTFCRSNNSDTERDNYERQKKRILLKDNTDFKEIISGEFGKDYFYQPNLIEYEEKRKKDGSCYENTNKTWSKYYKSTIVVPIRIEFKRLYHTKNEEPYDIIGFLCVDSEYTDAFTEKQEKYNVDIIKAYADTIYVLLSQYRHYLRKIYQGENAKN